MSAFSNLARARWAPFLDKGEITIYDRLTGLQICDMRTSPTAEAYSKLIAAAPALYEACEEALRASVDAPTYPDGPCLPSEVRRELEDTLKKARGEA